MVAICICQYVSVDLLDHLIYDVFDVESMAIEQ